MNRFYGTIGFCVNDEIEPGIWEDTVTTKKYYIDIQKNFRKYSQGDTVTGSIQVSNTFSVIMDPYLNNNLQNIRFVEWMGSKWQIASIEVSSPRLIMTLGGQYNE